ncbi:hypothetical protein G6F57_020858 [Rhizopus arrhizus]|nr:hypothetical protein G6F57_020858 [Rhizopus arrhizus]
MLHLPVFIQNSDKRYEPSDAAVSNIYLDNQEFGLYTSVLQRDEGAEAIRFKWHGPTSTKTVFAERSTHKAHWLDGASVKDRIELVADDVHRFMTGTLSAQEYTSRLRAKGVDPKLVDQAYFIANGIQTSIRDKQLEPVCH